MKTKKTVQTPVGALYNVTNGPLNGNHISKEELLHAEKAIIALPNGKPKTQIAKVFSKFYKDWAGNELFARLVGGGGTETPVEA